MITVLRLGHRPGRDRRVTTHVALVARCFGAERMVLTVKDEDLAGRIDAVCKRFGGKLEITYEKSWRNFIREFKGTRVHLTMYGERLGEVMKRIPRSADLLVVVGAEKVPGDVYSMVDYNVAVGNQPHSEVSALALFLDRYTMGEWESKERSGTLKIVPSERGKKVVKN
ncbi:MAG: tRNA (cytidine(56)-2'-O)-methyltransferase [Methanomassiliicoccales archaeon]